MAGEGTAVAKIAAAASTTVSAIQGAQAAFTSVTAVAGPIAGAVAAGAAALSGAANVKKILSTKTGLPNDSVSGGGGVSASVPSIPNTPSSRGGVSSDVNAGIITRDTINTDTGRFCSANCISI